MSDPWARAARRARAFAPRIVPRRSESLAWRRSVQAAGECPCHLTQMLVIQLRVVTVQAAPPAAHAAAGLPHGEKGIEDNTIHAIVDPLQQLGVVLRKVIGLCGHARWLAIRSGLC